MKIFLKILIVLFLLGTGFRSFSQFLKISDYVIIAGYVHDKQSMEPIPYVNIFVKQTRRGTITNADGYFLLKARLNDSVVYSSVAHKREYTLITDSIAEINEALVVFLEPRQYEIGSIDIIALRRYQQIKYEITNMKPIDDAFSYSKRNFPLRPGDIDFIPLSEISGPGISFSPISALYDAFSKEGKERRKLEELMQKDKLKDLVESKISYKKIGALLRINELETEQFINWCNFSPEFLSRINDYDFIMLLLSKYKQYHNIQNK